MRLLRAVSSCKSHELYVLYIYKYLFITKYIEERYSEVRALEVLEVARF